MWWHWTKKESPKGHVVALDKKRKSSRKCGGIGQKKKVHKDMWWHWTKKESPQGHVVALDKKRNSKRTCGGGIGQKIIFTNVRSQVTGKHAMLQYKTNLLPLQSEKKVVML